MKYLKAPIAMFLAMLFLAGSSSVFAEEEVKKPAKIDWKETDAAEFAAKLEKATAAGEAWTKSPEMIILKYVGPFITKDGEKLGATRNLRIWTKGEELPKTLNVILIDDGLLDDSIRTQRSRLALSRNEDGTWKLRKAFESQTKWEKRGT